MLLLVAVFIAPSLASYETKGPVDAASDKSKIISGEKYQEKCFPYERCDKCNEDHYCDGKCDKCGDMCKSYEYCPKCSMTYATVGYADGYCDKCGSSCYSSENCDDCGEIHYYDGYCDDCGEKCNYNRCCEDCYIKSTIYEYCLDCGEKHHCDGFCDHCNEKCYSYKQCPQCGTKYAVNPGGSMLCDKCGSKCNYYEQCDNCGYSRVYDGYCEKCQKKCFFDRCSYVYCDKYCYEFSGKCVDELCPNCSQMKQEEVYGKSFTPEMGTSSCPSGQCAKAP